MLARWALMTCLLLGACACAGAAVTPPAAYPFGLPPPSAAETAGQGGWWWFFLAGLGLGASLARLGRRRLLERALRDPRGCLLPTEERRLRLALALLEEIIASAGRRGRVVRLADWLRVKARGPGGRL